jgi:GTP pyrophosphokinase
MVKVRQPQPIHVDGSIDLESWLWRLNERNPDCNLARIREVCDLSQQAEQKSISTSGPWAQGAPSSFKTGLDMADILTDLYMDDDGLVAAIIYRAVRENQITLNHVRKQFGDSVAGLVQGVMKMAAISNVRMGSGQVLGADSDQLEQARRMLVALVDDVRVALIKLSERTCRIRGVANDSVEKQRRLAHEVFDIYAPLANRLGVGQLKWELEDLSFRYLEPLNYKRIASLLAEKRLNREEYIQQVKDILSVKLREVAETAEISGRAKHIYSIWQKMQDKGISFAQVYDVRAVRLLVPEVGDCYRALGVVHTLWRNIPHEFDDYIAAPKANGYRSLHTAVIGPGGMVVEVQIRTFDMHEEAELGVCSHWRYKSNGQEEEPSAYEQRMQWLRQVLEWQEELGDVSGLTKELFSEVSLDRIYIFTPEGHVVDMNPGTTPIDFAYRVHTEIGHKCRGAKVNGKLVPLNTVIVSGDQVEIIVGAEAEPRREWLYRHLGYATSSRARAKIKAWFGKQARQKNAEDGKKILLDELSQLGVQQMELSSLLEFVDYTQLDDLFTGIGRGDIDVLELVERVGESLLEGQDYQLTLMLNEQEDERPETLIAEIGDLDYVISDCCGPVPGDSIVGVVDDSDLVTVHREDCLEALRADVFGRSMKLEWQKKVSRVFPVNIEVSAYDRQGLLFDIAGICMRENTNVITMHSDTDKHSNRVALRMTIEVASLNGLLQNLEKIEQLPNVISAKRVLSV